MKLASGTRRCLRSAGGVPVGLGTDGAASNSDSTCSSRCARQPPAQARIGRPRTLPAATPRVATREGAAALGMERIIGSLEPGKRADLIVVSMSAARQTPMYDPVHLVYATHGDDVKTTIVNGKILMRDGKVLTLNEPAVLAEARKLAADVRQAVAK